MEGLHMRSNPSGHRLESRGWGQRVGPRLLQQRKMANPVALQRKGEGFSAGRNTCVYLRIGKVEVVELSHVFATVRIVDARQVGQLANIAERVCGRKNRRDAATSAT